MTMRRQCPPCRVCPLVEMSCARLLTYGNHVAPAIITTAPTVMESEHETDQQTTPKKRGRLQQFTLRRRSFDPSINDRPSILRKSTDRKRGPLGFKKSQSNLLEEDGRLSTSQQRPETLAESR